MLFGLARCNPVFKRILVSSGLKAEDIENLTLWLETVQEKARKRKRFWEYEKLARGGTLAKEWVAGYTVNLDKYSVDLTEQIKGSAAEFIAHKEEVKIAERALCRREINNVLIVGESGSGRKSIIYGLAQKSLFGRCLPELNYKRFVELDMTALTAQIQASEQFEATLDTIFKEAVSAGNVVLVINEFHNFVGETPKPGIVDISGIITPYLRLSHFQIIAVTTFEGLHRNIEKNSSLLSLFEKIEVSNVPPEETLLILESLVPSFERKHKVFISYQALRDIISMTDRYLPALTFPEKAIDVLDQVVIYTSSATREKVVLPKHVAKIITEKSEIPVGEIDMKERNVLLNLEKLIHQRIINQDEAVKEVSTAMRRARSEVTIRKGPIGCFLFLGPTGVGKTETSKALAEFYFGSEKRMIRLDMSEFQEIKDISRLIGSSEETGLLTTPVRETPFSLLLLDEIEKANSNILNLFLQVLDEGHLTDGFGRKVDFKNTIIIATSNAGYQIILEAIKQQSEWSGVKPRLLDYLFQEQIFRPEFINRFDAVVVFKPLSKENLLDIAQLLLSGLKKNLQDKGIEFLITEPLKEKIVELSYKPMFGAREMKRVIQDKVENVLATALLSGKLKRGEIVGVDPQNFSLIINPVK
jgi:ATP-dependent Clp protease ATP-binding subunit ClpC